MREAINGERGEPSAPLVVSITVSNFSIRLRSLISRIS